ncbi:hypothetical protein Tco_0877500 [Tanacetum coccineum]|uniref:Uncharacterized protein n=1 Tax=Tanacetum coccineum TaxID=301880 RepID=A0ABQ5C0J1_9ASTR
MFQVAAAMIRPGSGDVSGGGGGKMHGFEVIVPGNANMEYTIIPSTEAKSRKDGVTRSIAPTRDGEYRDDKKDVRKSG